MIDRSEHKTLDEHGEELADKLVDQDGKFFGVISLPKPVQVVYGVFLPQIKQWLSDFGGDNVQKISKQLLIHLKVGEAEKYAKVAGLTTSYVIPYLSDLGNLNAVRKKHFERRNEVLEELAPLLDANKESGSKDAIGNISKMFKSGYDNNPMITHALNLVNSDTFNEFTAQATRLIPNLLNNYTTHKRNKFVEKHTLELKAAYEADDQKLLKELYEKRDSYSNASNKWSLTTAGAVQTAIQELVTGGADFETNLSNTSYGKVKEIGKYIHEESLDNVRTHGTDDNKAELASLVKQAFVTFQEEMHKKDTHYTPLPSRRLGAVSEIIADQLVDGDLDWRSLFNIIGKGELLTHKHNGLIADDEKVEKVLSKEIGLVSKHTTIDPEVFWSQQRYKLDDIKAHLASQDKDEKALAVFLHEDSILLEAGMKKKEIKDAREHLSNQVMEKMMTSLVANLATLPDEKMHEMGFDSASIDSVRNFAENPAMLARTLQGHARAEELKDAVRPLMAEQPDVIAELLRDKKDSIKDIINAKGAGSKPALTGEQAEASGYIAREDNRRAAGDMGNDVVVR